MFNLDEQVQQWRQRFSRQDAMSGRDLDELEAHLRDSIDTLTAAGLDAEEAFMVATHRLGSPVAVAREFGKVNGTRVWGRRVVWMIAGVLAYAVGELLIGAIALVGQLAVTLAGGSGRIVGLTAVAITTLTLVALAMLAVLGQGVTVGSRAVGRMSDRTLLLSIAVVITVGMVLKVFAQAILLRFMPVTELARSLYISNVAGLMWTVLMPITLLFILLMVRQRSRVDEP
jgi:hypothetical protein